MRTVGELKLLNGEQRAAFAGSFLGWTLDAFDFAHACVREEARLPGAKPAAQRADGHD